MTKLIAAFTNPGVEYPSYINASEVDEMIVLTVRGDATVNESGVYICGYASDKGKLGRCTPGDEYCNNYCNMAPQKGSMQNHPKPCRQVFEGDTVRMVLSKDDFAEFLCDASCGRGSGASSATRAPS